MGDNIFQYCCIALKISIKFQSLTRQDRINSYKKYQVFENSGNCLLFSNIRYNFSCLFHVHNTNWSHNC